MKRKSTPLQKPPPPRPARSRQQAPTIAEEEEHRPMLAELYRRAEAHLRDKQSRKAPDKTQANPAKSGAGPERLLHELEVHQIELELQNAELQKARDDLEVALEKATDLYDFAPVGYFSLDESVLILESNLTGAALLGRERSRLMHQRLLSFLAPDSQPVFLAFLEKVFAGAVNQSCEVRLVKAGGAPFWAGCQATLAFTPKGAPKCCRVAIADIALRKQAETVLRRNEALFTALIEQAPIGVYVVDSQFRLQQVNRQARPIFKNIQPLIGRDFSEVHHILWPKRVSDQVVARFRHTLKTGEPYESPEFVQQRRDTGVEEAYEWQIQRLTLPDGEHGVVAFFNNITERKRIEGNQRRLEILTASNLKLETEITRRQAVEQALKQSKQHQIELLEQSHYMQAQLRHLSRQILSAQEEERKRISRELHDVIAQTLTGINIRLATLKQQATRNTKGLAGNIARTQQLVQKSVQIVHEFARELRPAVLDDLGLVPALHSFMKNFTANTGVRTHLTTSAEVNHLDPAGRTVLYRVAQEALTNVARHARASQVKVCIQKRPDHICMKISDDGRAFQVHRVLPARGRKRLGLLGMRERLEMIGGRLTIQSAPGQGTTIEAQIPLRKTRGGGRQTR
jgi:PAS domain S-box-containing protein